MSKIAVRYAMYMELFLPNSFLTSFNDTLPFTNDELKNLNLQTCSINLVIFYLDSGKDLIILFKWEILLLVVFDVFFGHSP